jgi:hypothetical protein
MYDPVGGRFSSRDPIGFAAGSVNFYAYVDGRCLSYSDPHGLCKFDRWRIHDNGDGRDLSNEQQQMLGTAINSANSNKPSTADNFDHKLGLQCRKGFNWGKRAETCVFVFFVSAMFKDSQKHDCAKCPCKMSLDESKSKEVYYYYDRDTGELLGTTTRNNVGANQGTLDEARDDYSRIPGSYYRPYWIGPARPVDLNLVYVDAPNNLSGAITYKGRLVDFKIEHTIDQKFSVTDCKGAVVSTLHHEVVFGKDMSIEQKVDGKPR